MFGLHLGLPGRWRRVQDLRAAGVTLAGGAEVLEVTPEVVRWRDLDGDHETVATAVLVTSDAAPDTTLADELVGRGLAVTVVGDAGVGAGLLEHAMRGALGDRRHALGVLGRVVPGRGRQASRRWSSTAWTLVVRPSVTPGR